MESLKESLTMAYATLIANPVRSFLSILGVVIGIASVITILSFGAGTQRAMLEKFETMGVHVYDVYPQYDSTTRRMGKLEWTDLERLQQLPYVVTAFPRLNLYEEIRSR